MAPCRLELDWGTEPLFNYMRAAYADATLAKGNFRIGTLHEYQSTEYGTQIGDELEGRKYYVPLLEEIIKLSKEEFIHQYPPLAEAMRRAPVGFDEAFKNMKEGCPLALEERSPNCYLYCMTEAFESDLMKQFGYDACLQIMRPHDFVKHLTKAFITSRHRRLASAAWCWALHCVLLCR